MDIALVIVQDPATGVRKFDFAMAGGDLATDNGLQTAVCLSLFCDARAAPDAALPDADNPYPDRRGWWADAFFAEDSSKPNRLGSRLWLLEGARGTPATARRAQLYARAALQWLIDGNIAASVAVRTQWTARDKLALYVSIVRRTATGQPQTLEFDFIWSPTIAELDPLPLRIGDTPIVIGGESGGGIGTEDGRPLGLE